MITDLRTYLQEKVEPPVYVSDRRLVKAIQLLQVAAYCNGRDSVTEYDVLLLQHVLWQRPDTADKISDWVLSHLSADDGTKQVGTKGRWYRREPHFSAGLEITAATASACACR